MGEIISDYTRSLLIDFVYGVSWLCMVNMVRVCVDALVVPEVIEKTA